METPPKWRIDSWFLLHDKAPAHWLVLVKDFLPKNNVILLENSPYSPHLAPVDFYLFLQLRSGLKGKCFCDVTEIIETVTEELKSLSPNYFQKFQCFTVHFSIQ